MPDPRLALLAVILALPAPGCCTLARLFCGPDDSEWVQIDYKTAPAALATFMEAIRRDDCRVIYDSLGEALKRRQDSRPGKSCPGTCSRRVRCRRQCPPPQSSRS